MSKQVLVLNAGYEPLSLVSVRRAVVLLLREKAEMLEATASSTMSDCPIAACRRPVPPSCCAICTLASIVATSPANLP